MPPLVSIIMAVYNAEKFVQQAIESIINQTFTDFEFIIINDCCTDNTISIIESYNDNRLKIHHNETNIGLAASLNKGLQLAKGKYIVRMDDDDIALPHRLQTQVDFMEKNTPISICGSWVQFFGDENKIWKTTTTHNEIKCKQFLNTALAHPSVIMRKADLDKHHLSYNLNFRRAQDYDLFSRAANIIQLHNIPEVLLNYRVLYGNKKPQNHMMALDTLKQVRQQSYTKLNINFTDTFVEIHQLIAEGNYKKINIKQTNNWLKSIYVANKIHKTYPILEFNNMLADIWFKTLIYNFPKSLLTLPPYYLIFFHWIRSIIYRIR